MPQIGLFYCPQLGPKEAFQLIEEIFSKVKSKQFDVAALRSAAGADLSDEMVADLQIYGILARRGGQIGFSDLALSVINAGSPEARAHAVAQAALNVPLFRELLRALPDEMPPTDQSLLRALVSITGASVAVSRAHVPEVKALLSEIHSETVLYRTEERILQGKARTRRQSPIATPVLEFRAGEILQRFPFTPEGVELMMRHLGDEEFQKFVRLEAAKSGSPARP